MKTRFAIFLAMILVLGLCTIGWAGINDNLVAYYPFENNAEDASGSGRHGEEVGGVSYSDGIIGLAADFDGIDDYIYVNEVLPQYPALTISFWMYADSDAAVLPLSAACGPDSDAGLGIVYRGTANGYLAFWVGKAANCSNRAGTVQAEVEGITSGNMYHIVGVFQAGQSIAVYVNGDNVSEVTSGIPSSYYSNFQFIGTDLRDPGSNYNFGGLIDELRIYNSALTYTEIQELYQQPFTPETQLEKLESTIINLPEGAFKNNADNRQSALSQKIADVVATLGLADEESAADLKNELYQEAINKLNNDIRAKADGCLGGHAKNDWITDCDAQTEINQQIDDVIASITELIT